MAVQTKKFNWTRTLSGWEQTQRWNQRRAQMRSDFEAANQALANGFATVTSNVIDGQATLAGQAALKRIQDAAMAKLDKTA